MGGMTSLRSCFKIATLAFLLWYLPSFETAYGPSPHVGPQTSATLFSNLQRKRLLSWGQTVRTQHQLSLYRLCLINDQNADSLQKVF